MRLSQLKSMNEGTSLARGMKEIATVLTAQGSRMTSGDLTKQVCSLESIDEGAAQGVYDSLKTIEQSLAVAFKDGAGVSLESATPAQIQAMSIAASAWAAPRDYYASASNIVASTEGFTGVAGLHGNYDYTEEAFQISTEAFSEQELRNTVPLSVAYNFFAARQNAFGEAFYPTQTLTPDQAAMSLKITKYNVHNGVVHNVNGNVTDFKWRNIVEAQRDATILANDTIALVPVYDSGNATNAAKFMGSPYISGAVTKVVDGIDVLTRPLKPGVEMSLLGLSQHPGLIAAGLLNETDAIDAKAGLDYVYIAVAGTNGSAFTDVFKVKVSGLSRSEFQKSVEGNYRELNLAFSTKSVFLDKDTVELDGTANEAFTGLTSDEKVQLSINISGTLNVETGYLNVYAGVPSIVKIFNTDGTEVSQSAGVGQTVAGYTYSVVGYDIAARRSNANRRSQGLLTSPTQIEERYVIPLGSPITAKAPVGTNREAADLEALVNLTRVRNSNNAVTTLLNTCDDLQAAVANMANGVEVDVRGIARHLVKPTFVVDTLDLEAEVASISSAARLEDVQATIVNKLRDMTQRAIRDSGYLQALDILSAGQDTDFEFVVGCDQILDQYIMTSGDTRTLGMNKPASVVSCPDSRMDNTIIVGLRRKGVQGFDPLSNGVMLWIPELASSIQNNRSGAVTKESTVQPRSLHVQVVPVLVKLTISGLKEVLSTKLAIDFLDVTP